MLALAALLALFIGVVLGMLGGGGGILTVPMLVYVVGLDPKEAIPTSLVVVGMTSLVGAALHARAGTVRWKIGVAFGGAAMAGAFAGGHMAAFVPSAVLLVLFSGMMLVTATAMLRKRADTDTPARTLAIARTLPLGIGVGLLSGLVGAGGGFLIVPALTIAGGLAMREAIGTSLFVIALQSFAGSAGHASHVRLDGKLVVIVTGAAIVGTIVGALVSRKVPADRLRRWFACLVVGMGLFIVAKQVPLFATAIVAVATVLSMVLVARSARRSERSLPVDPGNVRSYREELGAPRTRRPR